MVEKVCAACGRSRLEWQGNDGQGYLVEGREFCCLGCADGTGCTCQNEPSS